MGRFIVVALLSLTCTGVMATEASQAPQLTEEFCESNADINGYLMVMTEQCGYQLSQKQKKLFADFNKKCISSYGQNAMYNITMSGVHNAKKDLAEHERNDVCSGIFKAYKNFFK